MRIRTFNLTLSTLADAPAGTIIIFVRPEYTCPYVVDSEDVSEIELTHAPDININIISTSGALLIARKE